MSTPLDTSTENNQPLPFHKVTIISTLIGQVLEWYDFYVYGALAAVIAELFFPANKPVIGLISAFAIFAVGFFLRPLGGLIFGYAGDKYGRKKIFVITLLLMSISTALVGLLPVYSQVGIMAPIMLVCLRLVQGLSVGGESAGSIVYLIEHVPKRRKAFLTSLILVAATAGWLLASLISATLNYFMTREQFYSWGWRVPFILGTLTGIIGLILRFRAKETPIFEKMRETGSISKNPIKELFLNYKKHAAALFIFTSSGTLFNYILIAYLPVYFNKVGKIPLSTALFLSSLATVAIMILIPLMGLLIDRIGTRIPLLLSNAGMFLCAPLMFYWGALGNANLAALAMLIGAILLSLYACYYPIVGEWFPGPIRSTGASIIYNLSAALIGGTAPLISTLLIHGTGSIFAPSFYVSFLALCSFLVALIYGTKNAEARVPDKGPLSH